MDSGIKKKAEALYGELGIDLTAAINALYDSSFVFGGFPFVVRIEMPNKETIEVMLEYELIFQDPSVKRHSDIDEALWNLKD